MFGVTDFVDAALDHSWVPFVQRRKGPAILITKNCKLLLEEFPLLLNESVILHATITGCGSSFLEPGVPHPNEILDFLPTIKNKEQVVIRIDPIIPLPEFIDRAYKVFQFTKDLGFTRHRISILDVYPHVMKRFEAYPSFQYEIKQAYRWDLSHSLGEHRDSMSHADHELRKNIINQFKGSEVCGEPGFRCSGCVSIRDVQALHLREVFLKPKDKQRPACACLDKKELGLLSTPCKHNCLYCYKTCQ